MTRIVVKELVWDEVNRSHINKHNISELEITDASKNIVYHKRTYGLRYLVVGRSGKRLVSSVVSRKGPGRYYLVTARDSDKKERKRVYEKEEQNT